MIMKRLTYQARASNRDRYLWEVPQAVQNIIPERGTTAEFFINENGWLYSAANELHNSFYETWSSDLFKQFCANESISNTLRPDNCSQHSAVQSSHEARWSTDHGTTTFIHGPSGNKPIYG